MLFEENNSNILADLKCEKKSSSNTKIYTVNEFMNKFIEHDIKSKFKTEDVNELFKVIRKKEKEFFNIIGYLEKLHV